jgi:hypothetical protein
VENIEKCENTNQHYEFSDGFFTYYVNAKTGKKKFRLDKGDLLVPPSLDDFCRKGGANS